jgi:hypothetical protein
LGAGAIDFASFITRLRSEIPSGRQAWTLYQVFRALHEHDPDFYLRDVVKPLFDFLHPTAHTDAVADEAGADAVAVGTADALPMPLVTPRMMTSVDWLEWIRPVVA